MRKRLSRWSKWLFIYSGCLMVLIIGIMAFLLYSSYGLNTVIWGAEKMVSGLVIDSGDGRLAERFSLHDISYRDKGNDIRIDDMSLSVDIWQLLRPVLKINYLSVNGGSFTLIPSRKGRDQGTLPSSVHQISSPVPVEIEHANLNNIHVTVDNVNSNWKTLSTVMSWHRSRLTLSSTHWQGIVVRLPEPNDESSTVSQSGKDAHSTPAFHFPGMDLPDIVLPVSVTLSPFSARDIRIIQGHQIYPVDSLDLGMSAEKSQITVSKLSIATPRVRTSLHGKIRLEGDYPLSLSVQTQYSDKPVQAQMVDLVAKGSLANLSLVVVAKGSVNSKVNANVSLTEDNLPFKLSAESTDGQWSVNGHRQFRFHFDTLSVAGNLQKYAFSMKGNVTGDDIAPVMTDMKGQGDLTNVSIESFVLTSLGGQISGHIKVGWADDVNMSSSIKLKDFRPESLIKNVSGNINGDVIASADVHSDGQWNMDVSKLDIFGRFKGYPLKIKGLLSAKTIASGYGVDIRTPGIMVSHGMNKIRLYGRLAKNWNMNASIHIPDLSKSVAHSSGQVFGKIRLTGDSARPFISIHLNGRQVRWQDLFSTNKISVNSKVTSFIHPDGHLQIALSHGAIYQEPFDSASLDLSGGLEKHRLSLAVLSRGMTGNVLLTGELASGYHQWHGLLKQAEFNHHQETLKLLTPVSLTADISHQTMLVDPHCWGLDDASLCLLSKASFSPNDVQASLMLKHLSLSSLSEWIPENPVVVKGIVNGTSSVKWSKGKDVHIASVLDVSKGKIVTHGAQSVTVGWDSASFHSTLQQGKLTTNMFVNLSDNGQLSLDAMIPDVTRKHKQVRGNLNISQFNLDFLQPLVGEYNKAGALINSRIRLSGELLHPKAFGQIDVTRLLASGGAFPVEVQQGNARVALAGYKAKLTALVNTPDGDLNIEGKADWSDLSEWSVNSHVFAKGLKVALPPMVKVKVIPDITLTLNPDIARIDGDISLPWGRVQVETLPESAIEVSSDQVIVDKNWKPIQKQSLPFKIDTNVKLRIGEDFALQAFGLKGYLDGVLKISQKDNAPFVVGDVNIVNGTYRSFGQDLVIQQGKVMMNGSVNKPYVSITAIRNPDNIEDDVTAGIKVSGPADHPSVTVFSDPDMAQANALSYLLRGQNLDTESNGDNSMTTALIGLSLAQSGHIVGELGQAIGVQDLQLETSGSGDESQVNVSGYVLPGLQVKYGVGIFNSVGEFTLRYRLMRNLYVEAVSGLTSAVDILYQFEFD
ncbi:autotransporter assembly complex protein TamB [Vibrio salinus]|uniref:autotransporter assembly complex protein TamB n=1 Tax=Vibrio salinus TaxID=2899784 RepID=UPI001E564134|nr:translocation/assembly module TamB domain-containing protein [Vibrio salinus]MCE0494039.1 translocation/assembly module TamB [Vibrio salinus]